MPARRKVNLIVGTNSSFAVPHSLIVNRTAIPNRPGLRLQALARRPGSTETQAALYLGSVALPALLGQPRANCKHIDIYAVD
jgi:hypothetical protein